MTDHLTDTNVGNIEYIRRQDVVEECGEWYVEEGTEEGFIGTVSQMLNMFSPADVVQVVRCKDCRYFRKFLRECERSGALTMYPLHDTDFCSYGEREK